MNKKILSFVHLSLGLVLTSQAQNILHIPDPIEGTAVDLDMSWDSTEFYAGHFTKTAGFNGSYLGPTLILHKGDEINFSIQNNLEEETTVHWHGMHIPANVDGGPHVTIDAGSTFEPSFDVLDHAATMWYHPHLHEKTTEQVNYGLAGIIFIRDTNDAIQQQLPRTYGEDEFPIILQSQSFDTDNELVLNTGPTDESVDMINGTINPTISFPAQMVRLHLLNADDRNFYDLALSNGDSLIIIATEGGLLEQPVNVSSLEIGNGERFELILDLSGYEGQTLNLQLLEESMGGMGMPPTTTATDFLEITVTSPTANAIHSIPAQLTSYTIWDESEANVTRTKRLTEDATNPGLFSINDNIFDMMIVDDTIQLDDIEIWEIVHEDGPAHPFHIHDIQFFILDINGEESPAYMKGPKDVVIVNTGETVRFITQFTDFADWDYPYMYHCHILPHEDAGMMGQFIVVDETTGILEDANVEELNAYPNPNSGTELTINLPEELINKQVDITLYNSSNMELNQNVQLVNGELRVDLNGLEAGMYFGKIKSPASSKSYSFKFNRL